MLVELVVRDLALIEHASLSLGPGFGVITGETGAGKSLLVGALELLQGLRPRPGRVRQGAKRTVVEGRFVIEPGPLADLLVAWLRVHLPQVLEDWEDREQGDERELILGRTIGRDGKTRAYVNQRPVTITVLRELASRVFEIHGQNDHQRLLEPVEQLRLLDSFGGLEDTVREYRKARARWHELVEHAIQLEDEARTRRDQLDLARYQYGEITASEPDPAEKSALGPEREVLRNAEGLREGLGELVQELVEADDALLDRLKSAERRVERWRESIQALAGPADELAQAVVHLEEAAGTLRSFLESLEVDPARLEEVEARLSELERLEKKYDTDAAGLLARARELEAEILRLESEEQDLDKLTASIPEARAEVLARGGELRRARKALKGKLVRAVGKTLEELGLEKARFELRLGQRAADEVGPEDGSGDVGGTAPAVGRSRALLEADLQLFGELGIDRIEFLLAANPGEPMQRLRQVASGGETARIMLALRSVLARSKKSGDRDRTLIFDEVDAGVGGRLGPAVGKHLEKLAERHQVLCVTHLPAIAALAGRHLRARKTVEGGRTITRVEELSGEARVDEIADMIAGGADQETARAEARRLIGS